MNVTTHPIVDSYWIEELPNGVIHLLINCNNREFYCHQFNDTEYLITKEDTDDYTPSDILTVPDFLNRENAFIYIPAIQIEKDQISYYFIPYQKDWIQNRKFLIE
jgi:hypothetical protein